jgi:hypothetical protein
MSMCFDKIGLLSDSIPGYLNPCFFLFPCVQIVLYLNHFTTNIECKTPVLRSKLTRCIGYLRNTQLTIDKRFYMLSVIWKLDRLIQSQGILTPVSTMRIMNVECIIFD